MVRFKTQIKGYDKRQVEEFIHKSTEFSESKIHELEKCVERLKEENDYLYAKNAEHRRNEERVSAAIVKAMEVKNTLESEMKAKIALEEDRLNLFKEKWGAFASQADAVHAENVIKTADEFIERFRKEFVKKANRELNLPPDDTNKPNAAEISYQNEQKRLQAALSNAPQGEKMSAASLFSEQDEAAPKSSVGFFDD